MRHRVLKTVVAASIVALGLPALAVAAAPNQFGEGWDAMKAGWHSGSNKQSPVDDAILAIQTAVKVANGIEVPTLQGIETPKVLPENVDDFERPTW